MSQPIWTRVGTPSRLAINDLVWTYKLFTHRLFDPYGPPVSNLLSVERPNKEMSTQDVFVQQFAQLFQHYREGLSPEAKQGSVSWNAVPLEERNRMVAAARLAIHELETDAQSQDNSRLYFAKPGEAEWGC